MKLPDEQQKVFDRATEVLEKLLELMDVPAKVNVSDAFTLYGDNDELSSLGLNIQGDDLGILIGRRGQTMASLQQIVRLIVANTLESKLPIIIDVEGYKERRCEGLRALANRLADQVKARRAPFAMEPMPAFERRIIHLALADHPDVMTESTGIGEGRKVVIKPRKIRNY